MGTVERKAVRKSEAGYALLDSLIALTLITITLSSVGLLMRSVIDRGGVLVERSAVLIAERNKIDEGHVQ